MGCNNSTTRVSVLWSDSNRSSSDTYFTLWNNGTVDNMQTTIQITTPPTDLFVQYNGTVPATDDYYGLKLTGGTISAINDWVEEDSAIQLDSDIDSSGSNTFGFTLYMSNITANHTWQTLVVTLTGSQA